MKKKTVSGIMLTLLLIGMLTLAFNIQQVKASPDVSPYIAVVPESAVDPTLTPGMRYMVSIYTDYSGDDVWGYEFELTYNPRVLEGVEVSNGDLITEDVGTIMWFPGSFDNTAGRLSLTGSAFFSMPGMPVPVAPGPGILANVTFSVVDFGDSYITLREETRLIGYDPVTEEFYIIIDAKKMPSHIQHGFFSNAHATPATVDIAPDTLHLMSQGKWITCYIELPEGYNPSDIDISTVMVNDTIPVALLDVPAPHPVPTEIGDYDSDGILDLMVKFDRAMVSDLTLSKRVTNGYVTLTITGEVDGAPFEGTDAIRVLMTGGGTRGSK